MSTIAATNLKNASSGSNNIVLNTDGSIGGTCLTQTCRAWVNFNGTGTVAIRASYNVSSITDGGVGIYTVNFASSLPDANYSVVAMTTTRNPVTATSVCEIQDLGSPSIAAGSVTVTSSEVNTTLNRNPVDRPIIAVSIFR